MKNLSTLLLVLINFFSLKTLALDFTEQLIIQEDIIESVSKDIQHYNDVHFNFDNILSDLKSAYIKDVKNAVEFDFKNTLRAQEEAKKRGKNAEHCFTEPNYVKTAYQRVDDCESVFLEFLQSPKQIIKSYIHMRGALQFYLDEAFSLCTPTEEQLCSAEVLPRILETVKNYQSLAEEMKKMGEKLSRLSRVYIVQCLQIINLKKALLKYYQEAIKCAESL